MAFKFSTGLKNYLATTGSLKNALENGLGTGVIKLFKATSVPPSPDSGLSGYSATLLLTYTVDGLGGALTMEESAIGGVLHKSADIWKGEAIESANIGDTLFFRFEDVDDYGDDSTTQLRIQGTAGVGAKDLILTSSVIEVATNYFIDSFLIEVAPDS